MLINNENVKGTLMFNGKKEKNSYRAIANAVICFLSAPLLSSFGFRPGGLVFSLYWLTLVMLIIVFLVVPYFKTRRNISTKSK